MTIITDSTDEVDERFSLVLQPNPVNATLSATESSADGIINDDDGPTITINDPSVPEGNAGQSTDAIFTVTLSAVSPQAVTVSLTSASETAIAPASPSSRPGRR